jgi:hypothetical protein
MIWRIEVLGQLGQKVSKIPSQPIKLGMMVRAWHLSYVCERCKCSKGRSPDQPAQKHKTLSQKITKAKEGWECGSSGEHLPSKCKALSSNPSTTKELVALLGKLNRRIISLRPASNHKLRPYLKETQQIKNLSSWLLKCLVCYGKLISFL